MPLLGTRWSYRPKGATVLSERTRSLRQRLAREVVLALLDYVETDEPFVFESHGRGQSLTIAFRLGEGSRYQSLLAERQARLASTIGANDPDAG